MHAAALLQHRRRIAKGIATGMEILHSKGVIHCDLKPSNVLVLEAEVRKHC